MQQTENIRSISIIGPGNVGWHLAIALKEAGYEILHIVARNPQGGTDLNQITGASLITNLDQLSEEPDLFLITVQDSEIDAVAQALSGSEKIIAHTSGGRDMSVFYEKKDNCGIIYPLQTFTRGVDMNYSDIPFLLEAGSEKTLNVLKSLVAKISGSYRCIAAQERLSLHLAAVFACNFSNHMISIAEYLLKKDNLDLSLLQPLMKQTLKKLENLSPKEAQTGPAIRNDQLTMNRHLELLTDEPGIKELYKALSQSIQQKNI